MPAAPSVATECGRACLFNPQSWGAVCGRLECGHARSRPVSMWCAGCTFAGRSGNSVVNTVQAVLARGGRVWNSPCFVRTEAELPPHPPPPPRRLCAYLHARVVSGVLSIMKMKRYRPRCEATTRTGLRCRMAAVTATGRLCVYHHPAFREATHQRNREGTRHIGNAGDLRGTWQRRRRKCRAYSLANWPSCLSGGNVTPSEGAGDLRWGPFSAFSCRYAVRSSPAAMARMSLRRPPGVRRPSGQYRLLVLLQCACWPRCRPCGLCGQLRASTITAELYAAPLCSRQRFLGPLRDHPPLFLGDHCHDPAPSADWRRHVGCNEVDASLLQTEQEMGITAQTIDLRDDELRAIDPTGFEGFS